MKISVFKKVIFAFVLVMIVLFSVSFGAIFALKNNSQIIKLLSQKLSPNQNIINERVVNEESIVIDIAEKVSPSVVTVTIQQPARRVLEYSPFGGISQRTQEANPQDIGSGFVVKADGLIVTNKHVVSQLDGKYKVVTKDGQEYEVKSINRDPSNDLAILKIDASNLPVVELGSSDNLKVGQFVVAIGTALGEFRHTVTTGVISGLGRGITAGDPFEGYAEKIDDVIQTDAAINPGNSGGPLLNSAGQVIGVNVAVAAGAQNIGFALPSDILKKGLEQFSTNGNFASKAFLGVGYQMIDRETAVLNKLPQGAYIQNVVEGSPAEKAGILKGDILLEIDNKSVSESQDGLGPLVAEKNAGDTISIKLWRDGKEILLNANLSTGTSQ